MRGRLDELNGVAFGILHIEPEAAVGGVLDLIRDRDPFGGEILAKLAGIGGDVAEVIEAVRAGAGRQGQDFHELFLIDVIAGALRVLRVGSFLQADLLDIEVLRLAGVAGVDRDMGDAEDGRPGLGGAGGGQQSNGHGGNLTRRRMNLEPSGMRIKSNAGRAAGGNFHSVERSRAGYYVPTDETTERRPHRRVCCGFSLALWILASLSYWMAGVADLWQNEVHWDQRVRCSLPLRVGFAQASTTKGCKPEAKAAGLAAGDRIRAAERCGLHRAGAVGDDPVGEPSGRHSRRGLHAAGWQHRDSDADPGPQ